MQEHNGIALAHFHVCHVAPEDSPPLLLVRKCRRDHVRSSSSSLVQPNGPTLRNATTGPGKRERILRAGSWFFGPLSVRFSTLAARYKNILRKTGYIPGNGGSGCWEPFLEVPGEMVPEEGVEPTRGVIPGRF